jgi:hypothetical protein
VALHLQSAEQARAVLRNRKIISPLVNHRTLIASCMVFKEKKVILEVFQPHFIGLILAIK